MDESVEKKKKKKKILFAIIPIVVLFSLVVTFFIVYSFNPKFKAYADEYIKKIPVISRVFEKSPTEEEIQRQKKELAKYYSSLDIERAVDKLMLLKKQDKKFYSEMINIMKTVDFKRVQGVVQEIGIREMKKDTLKRELESMNSEMDAQVDEFAKYYTELGLYDTVKNIEQRMGSLEFDRNYAAKILESLDTEYCAKILYYMNFDMSNSIKVNLRRDFLEKIDKELVSYEKFLGDMESIAVEYERKDYCQAALQLSNEERYSREEVSNILFFLSSEQAGKIISEFQNAEYKDDIIKELVQLKRLNSYDDIEDIYAVINIMSEYKDKVTELSETYRKMDPEQVAEIAMEMTSSNQIYEEYNAGNVVMKINEEELLIEILGTFDPKFRSEIFVELGISKSAELTRKMGLPSQEG